MNRPSVVVFTVWLIGACAFDVVRVEQRPAQLDVASLARPLELTSDVEVAVGPGYRRTLRQGSRWVPVGAIAEGNVYRSRDQVLTVEASNIHEAWLVVREEMVVGFYLPVERTFSPMRPPTALAARETQ